MMKPPQWDEKSTALAYYRTKSLSHMDACSVGGCSELDKVKWMSIRGVHSCATGSKGPPQAGTVTCPAGGRDTTDDTLAHAHTLTTPAVAKLLGMTGTSGGEPACREYGIAKAEGDVEPIYLSEIEALFHETQTFSTELKANTWRSVGAWVHGRYGAFVLCEEEDSSWGTCEPPPPRIAEYNQTCTGADGATSMLMEVAHEYMRNSDVAGNPWRFNPRPLPVWDKLSRAAYYHVMTHWDKADTATGCDMTSASTSCYDVGSRAAKAKTDKEYLHDDDTTVFRLDDAEDCGCSFTPTAWLEKTTNLTVDSNYPPKVITVWSDGLTFDRNSVAAAFNRDCVGSRCSTSARGNQNKHELVSWENGQHNAMGVHVYGRLGVIYIAKLTGNFNAETEVGCRSLPYVYAFNRRCNPSNRYGTGHSAAPDPHAIISKQFTEYMLNKYYSIQPHNSTTLEMPERVAAVAYYRAKALEQVDWCYKNRCTNKVPWMHTAWIRTCEAGTAGGPSQYGTVTCPTKQSSLLNDAARRSFNENARVLGVHGETSETLPNCRHWVLAKTALEGNIVPSDFQVLFNQHAEIGEDFRRYSTFKVGGGWIAGRTAVFVVCHDEAAASGAWGPSCPMTYKQNVGQNGDDSSGTTPSTLLALGLALGVYAVQAAVQVA
eukprot:GHVU01008021.1.p1 GENE.GHVU01008021.1~~GHVU01008021.1.p1  ORF type:complete len:669 (-),score=93.94 GHVU01008021.1:208-2181(-)